MLFVDKSLRDSFDLPFTEGCPKAHILKQLAHSAICEIEVARGVEVDEANETSLRAIGNLPSIGHSLKVVGAELLKAPQQATKDDAYRELIQPHLDSLVGLFSVIPLRGLSRYIKNKYSEFGEESEIYYIPSRVVNGTVSNNLDTPLVFDLHPTYKFRTMRLGSDKLYVPGNGKCDESKTDPRIIPSLAHLRSAGLDEAPQALQLLNSPAHHVTGLRALDEIDHHFIYTDSKDGKIAKQHLETLSQFGVGLTGPMHKLLHENTKRDQESWLSIINTAIESQYDRPHTLKRDLNDLISTGSTLIHKVIKKILKLSK